MSMKKILVLLFLSSCTINYKGEKEIRGVKYSIEDTCLRGYWSHSRGLPVIGEGRVWVCTYDSVYLKADTSGIYRR